jgi:hypothetical protein
MTNAIPIARRYSPLALLISGVLVLAYAMSGADPSADVQQPVTWPPTVRCVCFGLAGVAGILSGCIGLAFRRAQ